MSNTPPSFLFSITDTLKLYTKAHGAKTMNLIINMDNDDWILSNDDEILANRGIGKLDRLHLDSINNLITQDSSIICSRY